MRCHLPKLMMLGLLAACSSSAFATITINTTLSSGYTNVTVPSTGTTAPGSSPVPSSSPAPGTPVSPTFYFANIALLTDTLVPPRFYGDGITACNTTINPKCINSGASLVLSVTSTVATTGTGTMYLVYCSTGSPAATIPGTGCATVSQVSYTGNTVFNFTIPWATICGNALLQSIFIDMNGSCGVSNTAVHQNRNATLFLVADPTNAGTVTAEILPFNIFFAISIPINSLNTSTGFQDFLAFPGDQRVHINNPITDTQFPQGDNDGVGIQSLRLFYVSTPGVTTFDPSTTQFSRINFPTTLPGFGDLGVNTDGSLTATTVEGLVDGDRYYFRSAQVDKAGNIGYLEIDTDGPNHSTVPDQVTGLIGENGHCFIATAAYGSPMAEQVQILRNFRDTFLMKTLIGRNFVSWYYRHSPKWAAAISQNERARAVTRGFLYPLVGYSWLALKWGATNAALFLVTMLLLPLLMYRVRKNSLASGDQG